MLVFDKEIHFRGYTQEKLVKLKQSLCSVIPYKLYRMLGQKLRFPVYIIQINERCSGVAASCMHHLVTRKRIQLVINFYQQIIYQRGLRFRVQVPL